MSSPLSYVPQVAIRRPAPGFTATAWDKGKFRQITLEEYRGKYVVLFFYPLDFTFVCPTEIISFSDYADQFLENDAVVIGVSVDSQFTHREYTLKPRDQGGLGPMKIPLVADLTKDIGKKYGVYLDHSGDNGVHLRGTFIIDAKGILRHISVNDLPVGRNIPEYLRLVQAFQYTDTYGEVCPESWHPGETTMPTDHESEKLQEFWRANAHKAPAPHS